MLLAVALVFLLLGSYFQPQMISNKHLPANTDQQTGQKDKFNSISAKAHNEILCSDFK